MDDLELAREVSIEVVYVDEHLIKIAATVSAGQWRGRATAYSVAAEVNRFADDILRFIDGGPPALFKAGGNNGIGLVSLRFYRIDRSGHIAGHAQLASGSVPIDHRPEQVSQLAVEFGAEAEAVVQFARQLTELARTQTGRVTLGVASEA